MMTRSMEQQFVRAPIDRDVDPSDLPGYSIVGEVESLLRLEPPVILSTVGRHRLTA